MSADSPDALHAELAELRQRNAELKAEVSALANANAYAAELLAALEEAAEREARLVARAEELDLQNRLDLALQEERDEGGLLERVCAGLRSTPSLGLAGATVVLEGPETTAELRNTLARLVPDRPPESVCARTLDVPIHRDGRVMGALRLELPQTDPRWCARWLRLLWSVGSQVGLALHRLRVEHENQRINAELTIARDAALEASRTKSAFLANMSHELRTPMNAIIGYSEMLIEEADTLEPQECVADLRKIESAGRHLLALINDILDLSKIEAGKSTIYLEPFPVQTAVDEVVATVRPLLATNQNRLTVQCPPQIGTMVSDLVKFRQTLFNLLSNATKFTEHGEITVAVSTRTRQGIEQVLIEVQDTGIGMTPDQIGNLFQPFVQADSSTTRKYGGTGLGLAISRRFCQMLGGDIRVASEPGRGSTFTIELPRMGRAADGVPEDPPAGTAEGPAETASNPAQARACVLVIDDSPEARELIHRSLSKEGFQVLEAASGESGLTLARAHHPDVITLDVMMPHMNGWQVLASLKADPQLSDIPVVLLSVVENKEIGLALGATDCLTKPIDWPKLNGLLDRLITHAEPGHILVVDDDLASNDLARRLLERDGWRIRTASNGREALLSVQDQLPALIVLDLMMPEMDGFSFSETLRTDPRYSQIPIVVLTSKSLTPDDHRRLNGQVNDILVKGSTSRLDLLATVRRLAGPSPMSND